MVGLKRTPPQIPDNPPFWGDRAEPGANHLTQPPPHAIPVGRRAQRSRRGESDSRTSLVAAMFAIAPAKSDEAPCGHFEALIVNGSKLRGPQQSPGLGKGSGAAGHGTGVRGLSRALSNERRAHRSPSVYGGRAPAAGPGPPVRSSFSCGCENHAFSRVSGYSAGMFASASSSSTPSRNQEGLKPYAIP